MESFGRLIFLTATLSVNIHAIIQSPPWMVKQPPTDELLFQVAKQNEYEKPFVIECEAEGEPAPKYMWIKNGKRFDWLAYDDRISQQPRRGTLVITSPRDEDIGQYQCFAHNEWGTATSNSVFVNKAELNSFEDNYSIILTADEGSPYILTSCTPPDGWPKPNVFWLIQYDDGSIKSINNSRMTIDPEGNLWFSNVTQTDASSNFTYTCAATSSFRNEYMLGSRVFLKVISSEVSNSQNLHEPEAQYLTRHNEVALRGKKIEIYCIFGGTPLPQIRWSKQGGALPPERVTLGNNGNSLIIKHVNFEDEGTYGCEASNGVGEAKSHAVSLKVMAAPYFTVEPEIINAAEEEEVTFRCEASGVPEPQITWIHNGKPIEEATTNPRRKVTPNSIHIERLEKKDTGNYGCNATNFLGYVYKDVYVNVLALAPEITASPKDEATVDGKTVQLTCRVFGAPKPVVKWVKDGLDLTGGRFTVMENGDLEIRNVNFYDAGNYNCHATNKFGSAEAAGSLVVKEHTKIVHKPEDYEVVAGTTATFRCNAVADTSLELTISWLANGQPLDFEAEPRFVRASDSSLTITKTTELDSGTYTCAAQTKLDEATAQATLIVQDIPNPPRIVGVVCKEQVALVQWMPMGDNNAPILRYIIQYNTSFTPDIWDMAFGSVPATDMAYTVAMGPGAKYTFRVIAWNKIGPSWPSNHTDVCSTQPDVPSKNPDNVEGKGTEPDNLVISWRPMPEVEHQAAGFHYRISWKRDIPGELWNSEEITDWERSSLIVPNQPTFQKYRIKVVAINERGEAYVAPMEVIGYSGEDVPTQAPTNFTLVGVISSTSALLSWNPVSPESVRGHFHGYKIEIWTDSDSNKEEILIRRDSTRAMISSFVPNSKNHARILVSNGRYDGPPSDTLSFDTPEGVPSSVRNFNAIPMGSSALYLFWEPPWQPNGELTGYRIYYQIVKGTSIGRLFEKEPHITDPKQMHAKLTGLETEAKYRIDIRATTAAGEGSGYFIEVRTRKSIPTTPDSPKLKWHKLPSDNRLAAIKVFWLPNIEGNPGSHFYVKYRLKGKTQFQQTNFQMDEVYIDVKGLRPGKVYEIVVVAVDGDFETNSKPEEVETDSIEDYKVEAGTSPTFRCKAVAETSLESTISWLVNGQPIDFEAEPRFVLESDSSLTITNATELDSGTYTCVLQITAQDTIIVQA